MKRLLIRADDLGYCEGINYGIAKSVIQGIIKTVGVMTNMPAVEHGLNLLKGVDVCYGQHTNICVGKPLTDPKLIPSITQLNGDFKPSKEYRSTKHDFVVLEEVILEIEAQYQRFVELTGEQPHYFEGHAVNSRNFFKALEIVAQRHGLKYMPVSFSGDPIRFGNSLVYINIDSMKPDYDPFASLKNVMTNAHEEGCELFVCHPGYLDAYILKTSSLTTPRPMEVEMVCDPEIKKWLKENDITLVKYDDL